MTTTLAILERAHRRLEDLYEISKLFASFETVEQTFVPLMAIATRTLPLRSAILMEVDGAGARINIWPAASQGSAATRVATANIEAACGYLVAGVGVRTPVVAGRDDEAARRDLIVIPLVVTNRPPFGALQVEGIRPLDEKDRIFVNAIATQLAIALDRDRAWRRDITRREDAEEGRTDAEAKGATSERGRIKAESSSDRYEALAVENARLLAQAQQAVRVREQILAIVSHDLRNPLGTILMATSLARGTPEEPRGHPQAVDRIQRAAERMLRLIEDLLDFASIEEGRLDIRRLPQDPGSMVHETATSFESVAPEKRLKVTAIVEPDLPKVSCDRDRLLQVLANLVGNATKATAVGGHISVRVERRGPDLVFAVADDGHGIGTEDMKHLFEPYWRSGQAQYKGTGLGLAIARGVVSAHGGRIWAESQVGKGATIYFSLPAAS